MQFGCYPFCGVEYVPHFESWVCLRFQLEGNMCLLYGARQKKNCLSVAGKTNNAQN